MKREVEDKGCYDHEWKERLGRNESKKLSGKLDFNCQFGYK